MKKQKIKIKKILLKDFKMDVVIKNYRTHNKALNLDCELLRNDRGSSEQVTV